MINPSRHSQIYGSDAIQVVNASHWTCIDEGDVLCYSAGFYFPPDKPCKTVYQPFAWIRIFKHTHRIIAARDHFGQEPFYYTYQNQCLIFGSTIADILAHLPQIPSMTPHLFRDCFMRIPVGDPIDDPPYSNETYYEGIYRVTPAHYLYINEMAQYEEPFWQLDLSQPTLRYTDERDYVEHFSMLLDESIQVTTAHAGNLAAEFSGGVDSTTIFVACRRAGLEPTLFTHIPPQTRKPTEEDLNVTKIIEQYDWEHKHYAIDADCFEPMSVFQYFSKIFPGPPPNLNCVLSNNLHQVVRAQGFNSLISGYGGDDGVSLLFPPHIIYHQQWREKGFFKLWRDWATLYAQMNVKARRRLKLFLELLTHFHPKGHKLFNMLGQIKYQVLQAVDYKKDRINHQLQPFYHSLREYEYDILQGKLCHEMRMRLEYSAITAKAMGINYIYPLLYPPLIEFSFSLPLEQKFKQGRMRCTAQEYLSQHVKDMAFSTKAGAVVPSTMQKCRDYYAQGKFRQHFAELPLQNFLALSDSSDDQLLLQIHAFMVKHAHAISMLS